MTYTQFYHQLGHWGETQTAHEQTPQTQGFHYASYQTNQTPAINKVLV